MRVLALTLITGGVVFAATLSAKLPAAGQSFPDTWPAAVCAIFCIMVGMGFWHVALRRAARRTPAGAEATQSPIELLRQLLDAVAGLVGDFQEDSQMIMQRLDAMESEFILPFVENRREITNRYGMSDGAQILVQFAIGERLLNRAWSAAADAYFDEARASLAEAELALREAVASIQSHP